MKIKILTLFIIIISIILSGCGEDYTKKFNGDKFAGYWVSETGEVDYRYIISYDELPYDLFGNEVLGVIVVEKNKKDNTYHSYFRYYHSDVMDKQYLDRDDYFDMTISRMTGGEVTGWSWTGVMDGPSKIDGDNLNINATDYGSYQKTHSNIVLTYNPKDGSSAMTQRGIFDKSTGSNYSLGSQFSESKKFIRFTEEEFKEFLSNMWNKRIEGLKELKNNKSKK